ncbi:MAG: 5'-methylthioadenosine/S-adenosylhomocysteine nucleosidase [Acholeplasmataceae bacterium]
MIVVIGAMKEELSEIKALPQTLLIESGIGKANAAMKLTEALMKHDVTAIYNFGFVGASHHYEIGDLILIEEAMYHDFDLRFFGYEKGQVPGCPQKFKSDETLIKKVVLIEPQIKKGLLYTGDYFMTETIDQPYIVDMEGAALYQVAYHYQIPIVSIKIVSDIVGMDNHYENYKKFESELGAKHINEIYLKLLKE